MNLAGRKRRNDSGFSDSSFARLSEVALGIGLGATFLAVLQLFAIFPDGQPDNKYVQNGDEKQAQGVSLGEAEDLVNAEAAENDDHQRIGPKAARPKGNDQNQLGDSVREQKNASEELAAAGKVASHGDEMAGDEIVAVVGWIVIAEGLDQAFAMRRGDEPDEDAAKGLDQAVEGLQGESDFEGLVKSPVPVSAFNFGLFGHEVELVSFTS